MRKLAPYYQQMLADPLDLKALTERAADPRPIMSGMMLPSGRWLTREVAEMLVGSLCVRYGPPGGRRYVAAHLAEEVTNDAER